MEFLILVAVCFIAWKLIDNNRSSSKAQGGIRTTTEILETPEQTTIKTTIVESSDFEQSISTTHNPSPVIKNIDRPAARQELRTVTTGELYALKATERGKERERLRRLNFNAQTSATLSPPKEKAGATFLPPSQEARVITEKDDSKQCGKCKLKLSVSEFWASSKPSNPDGLSKWCKACLSKDNKSPNSNRYKKCSKCGKQREKWNFHKSPKTKDGLGKWCVPCHDKAEKTLRKAR
jgi:hypothetical protein